MVSCAELTENKRLLWAEVIARPGRQREDDWQDRANGRMCVRLLSTTDCSVLDDPASLSLDHGCPVAVIDLRVFVPEVISVLGTFADPHFPEELGKISFVSMLLGEVPESRASLLVSGEETELHDEIVDAIQCSQIKDVTMLPPDQRSELARELQKCITKANLYGTQKAAFISALTDAVHCTQGPPGTGKVCVLCVTDYAKRDSAR